MSQLMSRPVKNERFTAEYFAKARQSAAVEARRQVQAERERAAERIKKSQNKKR